MGGNHSNVMSHTPSSSDSEWRLDFLTTPTLLGCGIEYSFDTLWDLKK